MKCEKSQGMVGSKEKGGAARNAIVERPSTLKISTSVLTSGISQTKVTVFFAYHPSAKRPITISSSIYSLVNKLPRSGSSLVNYSEPLIRDRNATHNVTTETHCLKCGKKVFGEGETPGLLPSLSFLTLLLLPLLSW